MTEQSWRLNLNDDDSVDELIMQGAYVHFEDLGDAYMLIADNGHQHVHLAIPAHKKKKPWVFEQFDPKEES